VSGTKDFSFGDNVGPIGYRQRLADVVIGDQDADCAGLEVEDNLLQIEDGDGVDATEGLVEQQEAGLNAKAACDFYAATLPPESAKPLVVRMCRRLSW